MLTVRSNNRNHQEDDRSNIQRSDNQHTYIYSCEGFDSQVPRQIGNLGNALALFETLIVSAALSEMISVHWRA